MTEQGVGDGLGATWRTATVATIRYASCAAAAGHLLVLTGAATGLLRPNPAIAAAIACSIIAVVALTELAPLDVRMRRVVAALIAGHGVAVLVMVTGLATSVPAALTLAAFATAAVLGVACLAAIRRASIEPGSSRPLTVAPRVAAVALLVPALVQPWLASASGVSMRLHAAIFLVLAALAVALLASMSVIALRTGHLRAVAGLVAWAVGWVSLAADLSSLLVWSVGGVAPMGPHQLRELDAGLVQAGATAGGLAIGFAIATSFHNIRTRHSAIALLVAYAIFGLLVAGIDHRIDLVTDFPGLTALRKDRSLADAIRSFALAGLMWQCFRQAVAFAPTRQTNRRPRTGS